MKEYYKNCKHAIDELIGSNNNSNNLTNDIIKHYLCNYIYEFKVAKDINYLNSDEMV